jgi:xanthine dehydrogenase accessory factor
MDLRVDQAAVIEFAANALEAGHRTWLVTVVEIVGSLPRPLGSILAYANGQTVGSVSGGCVEECLIERFELDEFPQGTARLTRYGVDADDNERYGLPCGGKLTLLVEALAYDDLKRLQEVSDALQTRSWLQRAVTVSPYRCAVEPLRQQASHAVERQGDVWLHRLGPQHRLVLVGAGSLAETLSSLALNMEYDVCVLDPRADKLNAWRGPPISLLGGELIEHIDALDEPNTSLITLTHDRDIDDESLWLSRDSTYAFIGALGSRRTSANRKRRLLERGMSEAQLDRIHAPVGLDIGSKTSMEIAVSILAQLTRLKRGMMTQNVSRCLSLAI